MTYNLDVELFLLLLFKENIKKLFETKQTNLEKKKKKKKQMIGQ